MLGQNPIPELRGQLLVTPVKVIYPPPTAPQALGCVLYACFILGRLCVPVFANMSREPFSTRALVLSIMHATLPGMPTEGRAGEGCTLGRLSGGLLPPLTPFLQSDSTPPASETSPTCVPRLLIAPLPGSQFIQMATSLPLSTSASSPACFPSQSSHLPLTLLPR